MNRIQEAFAVARKQERGALIIYLTGGFPNIEESGDLIVAASQSGADIIEVGIPFTDPIADGPVIQAASETALAAGASVRGILGMIREISPRVLSPLVVMSCFNPILAYGPDSFAQDAADAGVSGVLVADMPPAESEQWCQAAAANGLATVFLLAPTTKEERFAEIIRRTTGFVYVVSRQGVTGVRDQLPTDLPELVNSVKQHTDTPVAVGFGISNAEQVASVCAVADGAIVGSALVRAVAEQESPDARLQVVTSLTAELAAGCRK